MFKNITKIIYESLPKGWDSDANGKKWEDYDTIVCPDGQVIDMQKLLDDLQRAKAALVHLAPMFGGFINNLRYVYTFKVLTQATDGHNILVNPLFTYNMDLTEKCFVMAHEIMHCLLNHLRRGKGDNPKLSNIAADYEVNITLVEMGLFKLDTIKKLRGLVDEKYSGEGYETIYKKVTGSSTGSLNNKQQALLASLNSDKNSQSGGGGLNQLHSADYVAGWKKAMEDYKKGKLKL